MLVESVGWSVSDADCTNVGSLSRARNVRDVEHGAYDEEPMAQIESA